MRTMFFEKHLGELARNTMFFSGDGGDTSSSGDSSFGGSTFGSFSQAERELGLDTVGDTSSSGDSSFGGSTFGSFSQAEREQGLDTVGDTDEGTYDVSYNADGTATVTNPMTGESVTVRDGVAIAGSLDGFGVNAGDVTSAGLNTSGQFQVDRISSAGTTSIEIYSGQDMKNLLSVEDNTTIGGVPATISVDVVAGKTTITSRGMTSTINADGTITGDPRMFDGTYNTIDSLKAATKTIYNSIGKVGRASLGLLTGGLLGAASGIVSEDRPLSISEERALAGMQGALSTISSNPNMSESEMQSLFSSIGDGNDRSIITGNPITAADAVATGASTEGLAPGAIENGDGTATYAYDRESISNAYQDLQGQAPTIDLGRISTEGLSREQIVDTIFAEGLGREANEEGRDFWINSSIPDSQLYETIKTEAMRNGEQFTDFNLNIDTNTAQAISGLQSNIDLSRGQLTIAQGQLANFEQMFGNPLENYNQWFSRLDPFQAQALGQSEIKQNYRAMSDQTIADFARRGITDSGILSSVLVNFDLQEAEALAANRAQNMANYAQYAQNDAQIRLGEQAQRFDQRNTLTQNVRSAASQLQSSRSDLANLNYNIDTRNADLASRESMAQAEADWRYGSLGVQQAQLQAQQDLAYAQLGAQERESESRLALSEAQLKSGIAMAEADREASETSDMWALGTTLLGGLLS